MRYRRPLGFGLAHARTDAEGIEDAQELLLVHVRIADEQAADVVAAGHVDTKVVDRREHRHVDAFDDAHGFCRVERLGERNQPLRDKRHAAEIHVIGHRPQPAHDQWFEGVAVDAGIREHLDDLDLARVAGFHRDRKGDIVDAFLELRR